jgi:hypothetical protein
MNAHFVLKRDYSQDAILKFRDCTPEAKLIFLLGFTPNRIFEDLNTPLLFQVGTFPQDLILEVVRECVRFHSMKLSGSQLAWEGVA